MRTTGAALDRLDDAGRRTLHPVPPPGGMRGPADVDVRHALARGRGRGTWARL